MNDEKSMTVLSEYYKSLDSIPTPPLILPVQEPLYWWQVLLMPVAASLMAYLFLLVCTHMPVKAGVEPSLQPMMDRLAIDEMRSQIPKAPSRIGAFRAHSTRFLA